MLGRVKRKRNIGGALNKLEGDKKWRPNILLDDGGDLTALMHKEHKELLKSVKGVSEETTTGIKALKKMEAKKSL